MIPFSPGEYLASDSPELGVGRSFPDLPEVTVDPTKLEVTSGYSTSDEDLFFLERRLLLQFVITLFDKWLKTDGRVIWDSQ